MLGEHVVTHAGASTRKSYFKFNGLVWRRTAEVVGYFADIFEHYNFLSLKSSNLVFYLFYEGLCYELNNDSEITWIKGSYNTFSIMTGEMMFQYVFPVHYLYYLYPSMKIDEQ